MSFNAIRENKILAKISGFTVSLLFLSLESLLVLINSKLLSKQWDYACILCDSLHCLVIKTIAVCSHGFFFNWDDGGSGHRLNDDPDLKLSLMVQFNHISLPNLIQQWGWVTSSHNLSYNPSPTNYTYIRGNKHGLTSTNT